MYVLHGLWQRARPFAAKQPPVAFGCPQNALIAGTRIKCFMFALIVRFQELPLFVSGPVPVAGYFGQIRGGSCHSFCVVDGIFVYVIYCPPPSCMLFARVRMGLSAFFANSCGNIQVARQISTAKALAATSSAMCSHGFTFPLLFLIDYHKASLAHQYSPSPRCTTRASDM